MSWGRGQNTPSSTGLAALSVEVGALTAQRLAARAVAQVLPLDVVARVAGGVVVVPVLLDRVPRRSLGHRSLLLRGVDGLRTLTTEELRRSHYIVDAYVLRRRFDGGPVAQARVIWHALVRRHRYEICHLCGRPVERSCGPTWWHAPDELWLELYGREGGIRCIPCFTRDAQARGITVMWEPRVDHRAHTSPFVSKHSSENTNRRDAA